MTQKITVYLGIAVLAAVLFGGLTLSQTAFAGIPGNNGQEKITLCHVDQETGEEITITVGAPAVPAHLAHGDTLGECSEEPSTCDECIDALNIAVGECGDIACEISALQAFAECTLTCEGEAVGIPEFCFNTEAGSLATCLDFAETGDDLGVCSFAYLDALVICAGPP